MELEWFEKNLIVALRVLVPFFKKYNFYIDGMDLNGIDGEYIRFNSPSPFKVTVILNPGFDILIERKEGMLDLIRKKKTISLVEEKIGFSDFSYLPNNFKDENDLAELLKNYLIFFEANFQKVLRLERI